MLGMDGNPHGPAAEVITSDERRHETIKRPCMFNDKGPAGVRTRPHAESLRGGAASESSSCVAFEN